MSYSTRYANPARSESVFLRELIKTLSRHTGIVPSNIINEFNNALKDSSDSSRPEIDRVYMMASFLGAHLVPVALGLAGELEVSAESASRIEPRDIRAGRSGSIENIISVKDPAVLSEASENALKDEYSITSYKRILTGRRERILSGLTREKMLENLKSPGQKVKSAEDTLSDAEREASRHYVEYPTDSPAVIALKRRKKKEAIELAREVYEKQLGKNKGSVAITVLALAEAYMEEAIKLTYELQRGEETLSESNTANAASLSAQAIVVTLSAIPDASEVAGLMGRDIAASRAVLGALSSLAGRMKIHHSRYSEGGSASRSAPRPFRPVETAGPETLNVTSLRLGRDVDYLVAISQQAEADEGIEDPKGISREAARKLILDNSAVISDLVRKGKRREDALAFLLSTIDLIGGGRGRTSNPDESGRFPMTPAGKKKLEENIAAIEAALPRISKEIGEAASHGDLKENAEYHAAREKQGMLVARLAEYKTKLAHCRVIDPTKMSGDIIRFGATVDVIDTESKKKRTFRIVGVDESDFGAGRISYQSPIAKALLGKEVGDESNEFQTPEGKRKFEILDVRYEEILLRPRPNI